MNNDNAVFPSAAVTAPTPFEFTGKGGEYFRIWIVNLALTLITVGIYSAWAKVRRLQYFYRNTTLLGSSFDYHGNPIAILKGRIIAVVLLALYNITAHFSVMLGILVFIALLAVMPWLVQRSLCFRLHYSSYRGLRFHFSGTVGEAYKTFLLWPVLGYLSLGLLFPLAHQRIKAYQHNHSAFGTAPFRFGADVGKFYVLYLKMFGLALLFILGLGVILATVGEIPRFGRMNKDPAQAKALFRLVMMVMAFYLLMFLLIVPWFNARLQNLVWNHTALGPHAFASQVRARDLLWLYVSNFVLLVLTLGLFKPFADIRLARYRLTHMALHAQGNLDEFLAREQQAVSATGEETADLFDVDISF